MGFAEGKEANRSEKIRLIGKMVNLNYGFGSL
jgi:hypothetical protein